MSEFSTTSDAEKAAKSQCLISFGSNLGDRNELIAEAARKIASSPLVREFDGLRTSRLFETPPIGGPGGQDPFLNAIGAFETDASAREILDLLLELENELGRQRKQRWSARSIDLDVVLHGALVGGDAGLTVPHPRYTARQFVLLPACDVAPHYRDPRFGWTLKRLTQHLSAGSASLALVGGDQSIRQELCHRLTQEHDLRTFAERPIVEPLGVVGNAPAPMRRRISDSQTSDSKANIVEPDLQQGLEAGEPIDVTDNQPWVSAYLPALPPLDSEQTNSSNVPRLVARIQHTTAETQWPAPHQLWPSGWRWPEYRLEVADMDWAVSEVASALDSMRCKVTPVTDHGNWWH